MKRNISQIMAKLCYGMGFFLSLYVGGWVMLCEPFFTLIREVQALQADPWVIVFSVVKMLLSATVGGLIWCLGYMGYNHFKGREELEWEIYEK